MLHPLLLMIYTLSAMVTACEDGPLKPVYPETVTDSTYADRTYITSVPMLRDGKKYPLVFVFHGAGGNGAGIRSFSGFDKSTWGDSCIFVYPDAKVENWDEGCRCNKPYRLGIDDIGFIDAIYKTMIDKYPVNTRRVYAVGFSQGGLFAHHVACRLSHRFAAVASVASSMNQPLSTYGAPEEKTSVLIIHGKNDGVLPYQGSNEGSFSLLSAPQTLTWWGNYYKMQRTAIGEKAGKNTTLDRYGLESGHEIRLLTPEEEGHQWFFNDFNTTETVLSFFKSKSRTP